METIIIIAKSAAILSLFYILYLAVLRRDTFFSANRHYLLAGIIAALVIPFIEFTKTVYIDMPVFSGTPIVSNDFNPATWQAVPQEVTFQVNWWLVALVVYTLGVLVMISRLGIQLYSLSRLLKKHPSEQNNGYTYVTVTDDIAPFSFFRTICYNPALHTKAELQMILEHEKVHASQWHTIDVLLTQVVLAFQWVNPLAWFYKQSLEQNLEFIADSNAVQSVPSPKAYQHTLVKVSSTALRPALTNQFYHSLIKKRIVMLNKEASRRRNLWKLGLVVPLIGLFMYSFNVKEVVEYREPVVEENNTAFAKADSTTPNVFTIDATATDTYLQTIEAYFKNTFESTEVRFTKVNHIKGKLVSFDFATKMKDDARFFTRFSIKDSTKGISPFTLTPVKEHELIQTYTDGTSVQYKPEGSETKIKIREGAESIGKNPVLIVNGNIIETATNTINYETDAGINVVNPKKAMALYGGQAKDGAIVIDDPNYTTKINGKHIQQPTAFVINHTTTEAQVEALEHFFREHHPDALIDVHNIQRDANNEITSYNIRTKFNNMQEWQNVLGMDTKEVVAKGLQVNYVAGSGIQLKELGPKGILMRSTPDRLEVEDQALSKGLVAFSEGMQRLNEHMAKEVRIKINKNTTDAELKKHKEDLKRDHDIDLSYNVRRNIQDEITMIQISYTGGGHNGNYSISGDNPIEEFFFYMTEDGETGFWSERSEERMEERKERMEARRAEMQERRETMSEEREVRRAEMQERREEMRSRMDNRGKEMKEQMKERKEEMKLRQKEMKERMKEMRKRSSVSSHSDSNGWSHSDSSNSIRINKNSTDEEIKAITQRLKEEGITFSFTKVKRNTQSEITGYRMKFDDNKGTESVSSKKSSDTPISPLSLIYSNGAIRVHQ